MRLTDHQIMTIRTTVADVFGEDAKVWLFGSRVDDQQRGGDIDLLIKTNYADVMKIARAEINLMSRLQAKLGEQKIDVLIEYPTRETYPPIFRVAKQTGIML
jgi:predicted nucleotidyltransferase